MKKKRPVPKLHVVRPQYPNPRDKVMIEIMAEMYRTDENNAEPTFGDYAADIIRRLNFITTNGASENA